MDQTPCLVTSAQLSCLSKVSQKQMTQAFRWHIFVTLFKKKILFFFFKKLLSKSS